MSPICYVVVLNWNGWQNTVDCVDSVAASNYPNLRIVVVDNGSTDDSVRQLRSRFPTLTILENAANLGFSGGCNAGINFSLENSAEYVWLLNNDTTVAHDALSALIDVAESNAEIGAVGAVIFERGSDNVQAWGGGSINFLTGAPRHFHRPPPLSELDYLTGASLLLRRKALANVGLLDEDRFFLYWEDVDLGFRLRKAGWKLAVAQSARVWHADSASTGRLSPIKDVYFSASTVAFFSRYAKFAFWPIGVGIGLRAIKRALRGNWQGVRAVLRGALAELQQRR